MTETMRARLSRYGNGAPIGDYVTMVAFSHSCRSDYSTTKEAENKMADMIETLELLMKTNPPYLSPDPKAAQHIDSDLVLRKIKIVPLITSLAGAFDHVMQSIKNNEKTLPLHTDEDNFLLPVYDDAITMKPIVDAKTLAKLYQSTTAHSMNVVASTMLLHLDTPGWFDSLSWIQVGNQTGEGFHSYTEDFALYVSSRKFLPSELRESLDNATLAILDDLNRLRGLAYWEIFAMSPEAENVLKEMGSIGSTFLNDICQAKGYVAQSFQPSRRTRDAQETGWGELVSSFTDDPRPGTRASAKARIESDTTAIASPAKSIAGPAGVARRSNEHNLSKHTVLKDPSQWHDISVPSRQGEMVPQERDLSRLFLQRAWAHSTEHDTTYTIFNCGNFERIGFRHRGSQTLFLSDLINIPECRDPHYGKIQLGLYLSVLRDVLDRLKQLGITQPGASRGKKRRKNETLLPNKRPRTRAQALKEGVDAANDLLNREIVAKEVRKRPLALLILRYGIYNSPAPASLLRVHHIRKNIYTPHEYLRVVITSKIAAGATGTVHGADIEILVSGTVRRVKAVAKLAFGPKESERMRHEFTIYEHLATRGVVEGIPTVYGLFEDLESDMLVLVMSHVGSSLVERYPGFVEDSKIHLPDQIRSAFIRTLRSIHAADVRHNDIRAENLAIMDDDRVAIIDFDRAQLGPSRGAKRREMRHLEYALNGEYPAWYEIPSPGSTPGSSTPESPED